MSHEENGSESERPEKWSKERPPRITTKSRGRVSNTLESLAEMFEERYEGLVTRYVYSPEHKPELSNVINRKAQGYQTVTGEDHPEAMELLGISEQEPVRVGDVILMAIDEKTHAFLEKQIKDRAEAEKQRIDHEFYDSVEKITTSGMQEEHKPRPRGRAVIEERDFEFEVEQGSSEEE